MKACVLLSILLLVQVYGAPVDQDAPQPGSCEDASAKGAAELAISKINQDRTEGYKFMLHRLSNVHTKMHGESGVVFYLTLDVVETDCNVLIKNDSDSCYQARPDHDTPVYGQCKAVIYISKIHRVVRLYRYNCAIRPVAATKLADVCPDCPTMIAKNDENVQKTATLAMDKFNNESGLVNRFSVLKISRATAGMAMKMYYNVEFMIQETNCTQTAAATDICTPMECEFAHKGFCKSSLYYLPEDKMDLTVNCSIYEPEAAEREKKLHLLGGEIDHSHSDSHAHSQTHDQAHPVDDGHTHDHVHDHTKSHTHHDQTHQHAADSDHHHTHDHAGSGAHRHAHDHSHDHGHGHDHVHAHHAKAHDHSGDSPNHHHDYKHTDGTHTHEHDHELALDHDHKHAHLHGHEHHHHHHDHEHETTPHDHPEGMVRELPSMDQPTTLPAFPDTPAAAGPDGGVTLPLKPDPQIPGVTEPTIEASPTKLSPQCPVSAKAPETLVEKAFAEDVMFKIEA